MYRYIDDKGLNDAITRLVLYIGLDPLAEEGHMMVNGFMIAYTINPEDMTTIIYTDDVEVVQKIRNGAAIVESNIKREEFINLVDATTPHKTDVVSYLKSFWSKE